LLCSVKFFIGSITNSIAITVDAANNLADAGSSIINLLGFKFAGKPADDEHPFGHGRIEYVSALIVAFIILMMGVELAKSSIGKIITPEDIHFSFLSAGVLAIAMFAKLWLAFFYRNIGKKIDSPTMKAMFTDSLSDIVATGATLLVLVFSLFSTVNIDGYIGLIVAALILLAGIGIIKSTIGPLLGEPPEETYVKKIEERVLSYDGIIGIHDLILHNYGPGRVFGSVHAEIPANNDIMKSHDTIDTIERDIKLEFGMNMVIHMDPLVVDDDHIDLLHALVLDLVLDIDEQLSMHDFRVVEGPTHTNLIFDLVTPHNFHIKSSVLIDEICTRLSKLNSNYYAVITVEQSFVKHSNEG
jgi:cation diffusion facilitator family transporter